MSEFARIESIDALKTLRTFLSNFAKKISGAVEEADFDILDTLNWLKNDRYPYWKNEVRLRNEQLIKTKLELKRKQVMERAIGGHDSCVDEIKAFAAAEKRLEEAQEKFKKVRSWILKLEKESFDCRGVLQSLANFIRIDLVNYRTQIDQMIYSLESYVNVAAPMTAVSESPVEQYAQEEMLSAARMAQRVSPIGELEQLCRSLRNRLLPENAADIATGSLVLGELKQLMISGKMREILKKNKKEAFFVSQDEKLVYEQPIELSDFIYFEHLVAVPHSGLTWYIGHVNLQKSKNLSMGRVADFLKEYPVMEEILSLPAGWIILVKKNNVEAVFNADNKVVVYATQDESEK